MKSLLRMVIFFMSLLFLPDPLFAEHPLVQTLDAMKRQETAELGLSFKSPAGTSAYQHGGLPIKERQFAQQTADKHSQKSLTAQKSKSGQRIKKKKSFFKSKKPLPAVTMPTDWNGDIHQPFIKETKTKPKSKTIRKSNRSKTPVSSLGRPVLAPQRKQRAELKHPPLPKLKGRGVEKLSAKLLERPKTKKPSLKPAEDMVEGKVEKAALVVPPPLTVWKADKIKKAQAACKIVMKNIDASVTPIKPIRHNACGSAAPLKVSAFGAHRGTKIKVNPAATLNCKYTATFAKWANEVLQPLAMKHLNSPVSMIHNVASYSCRHRYNDKKRKISEHAMANALDIAGFTLDNGTSVSVLKHWDEEGELGAFLKAVHASACKSFVVVLGPEANEAHKNHFHFDAGRYKVCE